MTPIGNLSIISAFCGVGRFCLSGHFLLAPGYERCRQTNCRPTILLSKNHICVRYGDLTQPIVSLSDL